MSAVGVALAVGLLFGLLAGGTTANAGLRPIRAVATVLIGVVFLIAPELLDVGGFGMTLVVVGYVLLLAFGLANLRLVGMPIVLLGLLLNLGVLAVNGGMPADRDALVTAGVVDRRDLAKVDLGARRHLERADDRITVLGDTLPVRPLHEVVSFGDLILAFGVADVVFRLLRPSGAEARQRRSSRHPSLGAGRGFTAIEA